VYGNNDSAQPVFVWLAGGGPDNLQFLEHSAIVLLPTSLLCYLNGDRSA